MATPLPRHRRQLWTRWRIVTLALVGAIALTLGALVATGGLSRDHRIDQIDPVTAVPPAPTPFVTVTPPAAGLFPASLIADWVKQENAKPGTGDWHLSPAHKTDMAGYADVVSAQRGDTVHLYVSSGAPTLHAEAYRMGYYGGARGRLIWKSAEVPVHRQAPPAVAPGTNMVTAPWQPTLPLTVDASWPPGDYLIKLVGSPGDHESWVPLTVRDDTSRAAYVIQNSVTTWQAYNIWGGYDLYEGRSGRGTSFNHRSRVVSFDRPYDLGEGSGDFQGNELPLVALAESQGLDVTYWTDVDLHRRPDLLLNHRVLLSLGHDEYWSLAMRRGVEEARNQGVNVAFLGANAVFRQIRLESSPLGPLRHEVAYKSAKEDPLFGKNNAEVTVNWREAPVNDPESSLVGDTYQCNTVKADMVIANAGAWVFAGTGLRTGDHLHQLVGPEFDQYLPGPHVPNAMVLAHSPLTCRNRPYSSDMIYYTALSGAGVLATGTNWWVSRLDYGCEGRPCLGKSDIKITENILATFGAGPAARMHPLVP